jgi:hypothetical protein
MIFLARFSMLLSALALPLMAGFFDTLAVHRWYEIPNTQMSAVDPCPAHNCSYSGSTAQASVMMAWSGGAFDTKRDRLIVWGGGHTNYAGNELYVFDLATLKWIRVTDPATDVSGATAMAEYPPAGGLIQPRSRHTYEYIEYVASLDRFCSFGFTSPYQDGGQGGNQMHCFDFDSKKWERKVSPQGWGIATIAAYDPVTGHAWSKGTDSHSWLSEFIPDSGVYGKWFKRTTDSADFYYKYLLTMDIDPVARKLVAIGGGETWYWDISKPAQGVSQTMVTTTGSTSIVGATSPGMAYDPITGKIVAWSGGQTIYSLDVPSKVWSATSTSGANPGSQATYGTYGRFRYSPAHNVFVVVNTTTSNVFIYKHTPGASGIEAKALYAGNNGLTASPNPFRGQTCLRIEGMEGAFPVYFAIHDIRGRLITAGITREREFTWNAAGIPGGLYAASLAMGNRVVSRLLVVLK